MPALFIYLIKVNIALLVFCLGYYAVLRHLTFYTLNRVYLVTAILFSALYPFIDLSAFINRHQEIARPVQVVIIDWQAPTNAVTEVVSRHNQWYWLQMAFWAGVLIFTIRLALQLLSLYRLHKKSEPMQVRHYMIRVIKGDINPFSFWQNIYVNPDNHPPHELEAILEHEQIHVNDWHTLDILLGEVSTVFYWFNPGIWLMKKAIRENIEFITDRKILQKGIDCKVYQYSLINVNFGAKSNAIVNHFNISTIKKRIMMMNAKKSSSINLSRYMLLIPTVMVLLLVFSVSKAELNKAASNSAHLFNKALNTVAQQLNIKPKPENNHQDILRAVSMMDIPTDSLSIRPQLTAFTFTEADTNKTKTYKTNPLNFGYTYTTADNEHLDLSKIFAGMTVYINGEKSTSDDLAAVDVNNIITLVAYTGRSKENNINNQYLSIVTTGDGNREKANTVISEFRKNNNSVYARNYALSPASESGGKINMTHMEFPSSGNLFGLNKPGTTSTEQQTVSIWSTKNAVVKEKDSLVLASTDKNSVLQKPIIIPFQFFKKTDTVTKTKTQSTTTNQKPTSAWHISTRNSHDTMFTTYTDANGVVHKPIVSVFKFPQKPDSAQSTKITKTLRNHVYSVDTTVTGRAIPDNRLNSNVIYGQANSIAKIKLNGSYTYTKGKNDTVKRDKEITLQQLLAKMDPNTLKNVTKMRINGVDVDKTKVDSLRKAMEGWAVNGDGSVTKSGQPQFFTLSAAGPIDFKNKLIIIDGKEATEKQLKKLSADKIGSISNMRRDTALAKYGKKAVNGVITITTKK